MKYHKYDPQTFLYVETVESDVQPENSVSGDLPEMTQFYTLAYIENEWLSVVRPEYEIVDNEFVKKESEEEDGTES
jgi:hypothetical protein